MKRALLGFLTAIVSLSLSIGSFANEYPQLWIECGAISDNSAEVLEYLGSEDYCYRIKVRCDQGLFGGFHVEVNTDDGGVGLSASIDDASGAFCFMNFGHLDNSGFSHSCDFDIGKADLDVKAVHGKKCSGTGTDPLCLGDEFCDDGNQCTVDTCNPLFGCSNEIDIGAVCDDADACTIDDACDSSGTCYGVPKNCDDGLSCTIDSCDPSGGECLFDLVTDTCIIDSVCYAAGDTNPSDPSQSCQPAIDPYNWSDQPEPLCGNSIIDSGETCDGPDLGGASCLDFGFVGGNLGCLLGCDEFDTSSCDECNDCRDCNMQACNDGQCGSCSKDSDCCAPWTCDVGTGTCVEPIP